jgi:menaquinone reductase, multiheme cytochrome c subunit
MASSEIVNNESLASIPSSHPSGGGLAPSGWLGTFWTLFKDNWHMHDFYFPNWVNRLTVILILGGLTVGGYLSACLFVATHPLIVNVGHQPRQPLPFSHKIHAGQLKLDCRYCHNTVEHSAHAAVPATATCGNCHGGNRVKEGETLGIIKGESVHLELVRKSLETGDPIEWVRVHNVPDFVYFNHAAHINRGVSCVSCHGRVDTMDVVTQVKPMSMAWCLDCHRNPEKNIRDPELVTQLDFKVDDPEAYGREWAEKLKIKPNVNCSTCHR